MSNLLRQPCFVHGVGLIGSHGLTVCVDLCDPPVHREGFAPQLPMPFQSFGNMLFDTLEQRDNFVLEIAALFDVRALQSAGEGWSACSKTSSPPTRSRP